MRVWAAVVILALGMAASRGASAQKTPPGFDEAYNKGQDLYNLGKYEEAAAAFEKARGLAPDLPGPYRWLGRTARAMERWRECIESSTQALRMNPGSSYAKDMREDIDTCRTALGLPAYDGKIPDGQGALAVITNVEGASVTVDEIKKGATPLSPIPLNPGKHRVRVERKGYLPVEIDVDVVVTIVVDTQVELQPDPNAPIDDPGRLPTTPEVTTGWLVLTVDPAAAAVTLDGKPIERGADGTPALWANTTIEEDPGIHELEITAPGYEPWRRRVVIVRGQKRTLAVSLKKTADRASERRIAYISFGAAAAFGITGIVFGFLENDAYEEAEDIAALERDRPPFSSVPPGLPEHTVYTREDLEDAKSRGRTYGLISNISYGVAIVALGVSVYYFIREREEARPGYELPMAVVPTVDPDGGAGAQVVFTRELDW